MLHVATAFSGGLLIRQHLQNVQLPKLGRKDNRCELTFKVSVRVLSAAVPSLGTPGLVSRQRPFAEVTLGSSTKETELADFAGDSSSSKVGACAKECPWRFSDTLTFVVRKEDVMGNGFRFALRAKTDISFGPLQFEMRPVEIGEGSLDLRQRVLPACDQRRCGADGRVESWFSPVVLVPFTHVRGGLQHAGLGIGEAVAHLALVFSVDRDPEELLEAFDVAPPRARNLDALLSSVAGRAEERVEDALRWMSEPIDVGWLPYTEEPLQPLTSGDSEVARLRADLRGWSVCGVDEPLPDPGLAAEGWVSREGRSGQIFWHHLALGPAPWDNTSEAPASAGQFPAVASSSTVSGGVAEPRPKVKAAVPKLLPCPEEVPEGWISHRGANGRTFWHHAALGPAPWLSPEGAVASPPQTPVRPETPSRRITRISYEGAETPQPQSLDIANIGHASVRTAEAPPSVGPLDSTSTCGSELTGNVRHL